MSNVNYDAIVRLLNSTVFENGRGEIMGQTTNELLRQMLDATKQEGEDWTAKTDAIDSDLANTKGEVANNKGNIQANSEAIRALQNLTSEGYVFEAVVKTTDSPREAVPTNKPFYIATEKGTYSNFGNVVMQEEGLAIIKWDGSAWSIDQIYTEFGTDYFTINGYISQYTADVKDNPDYLCTDFIPVKDKARIKGYNGININDAVLAYYYDEDKAPLFDFYKGTPSGTNIEKEIEFPEGTRYIRCSCLKVDVNSAFVHTNYVNLLNDSINHLSSIMEIKDNLFTENGYIQEGTGDVIEDELYLCTKYLPLGSKEIRIKGFDGLSFGYQSVCSFYDKDKKFISKYNADKNGGYTKIYTINTIPEGACYIRCTCLKADVNASYVACGQTTALFDEIENLKSEDVHDVLLKNKKVINIPVKNLDCIIGINEEFQQDSESFCSGYIPVKEGERYLYSGQVSYAIGVEAYNANREKIKPLIPSENAIVVHNEKEFVIPVGVSFIAACSRNVSSVNFSLKRVLYGEEISEYLDDIYYKINLNIEAEHYIDTSNGKYEEFSSSNMAGSADYIPVEEDEHYLVSLKTGSQIGIAYYDSNKIYKGAFSNSSSTYTSLFPIWKANNYEIVIPSGVSYIRISTTDNVEIPLTIKRKVNDNFYTKCFESFKKEETLGIVSTGGFHGQIAPNSGSVSEEEDFIFSGMIPVREGQRFLYSGCPYYTVGVTGYDENQVFKKTFIPLNSDEKKYIKAEIIIPKGISYIGASSRLSRMSLSLIGEPYLKPEDNFTREVGRLCMRDGLEINGYNGFIGWSDDINKNATDYIPVKKDELYLFSGNCTTWNGGVIGYNSKKEFVKALVNPTEGFYHAMNCKDFLIKIPEGISYIVAGTKDEINYPLSVKQVLSKKEFIEELPFTNHNETIVWFGNSLSQLGTLPHMVGSKIGAEVIDCSFAGASIVKSISGSAYEGTSLENISECILNDSFTSIYDAIQQQAGKEEKMKNYNHIISTDWNKIGKAVILEGTNDFGNQYLTEEKMKTSLRIVFNNLLTKNPMLSIYYVSPPWRSDGAEVNPTSHLDLPKVNLIIKSVCEEFNIPFFDLYHNCMGNDKTKDVIYSDANPSLHTSTYGDNLWSTKIANWLKSC